MSSVASEVLASEDPQEVVAGANHCHHVSSGIPARVRTGLSIGSIHLHSLLEAIVIGRVASGSMQVIG